MSGGIVTLLSLLGFLAIVVWVFIVKRREDFDEQAHLPLEDSDEQGDAAEHEHREKES
ncbi:CcoQ/FixQ family Cbb3-type cytochrome c oxidase assembly chaperone [Wenzhouxiangella sp. XN79A]|uniref:cbb3-type cytochrome oxidase subunit 3 n=1 Tax=Wenzhouxiangella sp. XN79A TaxID=2724193 RepID=UPI00144AE676|nr:CcoQ/FixQ family Cbb3-type cytochrome c oxidase assembly chaperone [Wenzhouxiangella sp. XN79A]NKI35380.1 CcoQ/FixQ family Cbb3-type cytochrome c oxidase assembly chaperone [Wenzhouxiangella sp. XN79A]